MRENLFDMSAKFEDEWSSDNKKKSKLKINTEIKEPQKHQLHTAKEKRRSKVVTIIKPFHLSKDDMNDLLKKLKKRFSTGGTIKDDSLEFQGDIAENIKVYLIDLGYGFKKK
ncbi:MAG: translation initiation factor [Sulfurovum sp.]